MRPYDSDFLRDEACPKCGEQRFEPWPVYYEPGRVVNDVVIGEYLELHCPRCGYKVFMHTKDDPATEDEATRTAYEDAAEAAYKEEYGPDFDKLATYQAEGR